MNKTLILLLLCFIAFSVKAVPSIGVVKPLYENGGKFHLTPKALSTLSTNDIPNIATFNQKILKALERSLVSFPHELEIKLVQSNSFTSFNAQALVDTWALEDPEIMTQLELEPVSVNYKYNKSVHVLPNTNPRYVLIGWISSINSQIIKNVIKGSGRKSVVYNLDINIKYKVVDFDTHEVISNFVAGGHGGFATIVPLALAPSNYDPQVVVDNMISSLLDSILHGLLIKQSQGLLGY